MTVPCSFLFASLLCVHVVPVSTVTLTQSSFGIGAGFKIEGPGFTASYTLRDVVPPPFNHVGASRACVGGICLDYRRDCKTEGEATNCLFSLDHGAPADIYLKADSAAGLQYAMKNIALDYAVRDEESSFPLSLLDGSVLAPLPDKK